MPGDREFTCPACGEARAGKTRALRAFRRQHARSCGIEPQAAAHRLVREQRPDRPRRRPTPSTELRIPPPPLKPRRRR